MEFQGAGGIESGCAEAMMPWLGFTGKTVGPSQSGGFNEQHIIHSHLHSCKSSINLHVRGQEDPLKN